jgi:signal transduction histidine kinase
MDRAFLVLRAIVLLCGLGWLYFAPLTEDGKIKAVQVFVFYTCYVSVLYAAIFFNIRRIRIFYLVGLIFDLIFIFLLLMLTGGVASSFFIAFYILVALHSFYYGLKVGLLVSLASSMIYFVSYVDSLFPIHWTDFSLRIFFMFILSVSAGLLTRMMRRDRERIAQLNQQLRNSLGSLQRAQQKLIETAKLTALGEMTMDIAHEIRNPLVAIGGYARRCNAKIDPELPEKKYARIIVDEVERLEKILRDLLTFSREKQEQLRDIEISPIIERAAESSLDELARKRIRINREYNHDLPRIRGDEHQLEQLFIQLIGNAEQAMTEQGVLTLRAHVRNKGLRPMVCIEVEDTGTGIPPKILERIFDPFFTTKENRGRTGLGLSVSRRIVEEHGGTITVASKVGKGSIFSVLLPAAQAQSGGGDNGREVDE